MNTDYKNLADKKAWEILEQASEILEDLGVKYWISAGTLLGAHRDSGFIPWDSDIDIEILSDEKLFEFKQLFNWPVLQTQKNMYGGKHYSQMAFLTRDGIILDIYPFYRSGHQLENISGQGRLWYPAERFENLTEITLYNKIYPCPDPAWYVKFRYGPDWNIPTNGKDNWETEAYNLEENNTMNTKNTIDYLSKLPRLGEGEPLSETLRFHTMKLGIESVVVVGIWAEFGTGSGFTTKFILEKMPKNKVLHCFDSWNGLPQDWFGDYKRGRFDYYEKPELIQENYSFWEGLFDAAIPDFMDAVGSHNDFAFIHVDCDLYCSTKSILDNCGPRIVPGTIIVFDEYYNYPAWKEHEYRAFMEWCDNNDRDFEYLGRTVHWQTVVKIIK